MKILFIQLPEQDPSGEASRLNVALDAGNLIAYGCQQKAVIRSECRLLDQNTSDHGGDAAIALAIYNEAPDLALFHIDPANLERSQWIAKRLRSLMASTYFIAWGPESIQGTPVFSAQTFDSFIEGEAELCFVELLADLAQKSLKPLYVSEAGVDLAYIPDPYLEGILVPSADKPVFIETMRCNYSLPAQRGLGRVMGPIRYWPRDKAAKIIRLASEKDVRDIYFTDPRFDARADLPGFIKSLAAANEGGLGLHTQLDPAMVSDEVARLFADASIASARALLPSTNPQALENLGLHLDKDAFERGCQLLAAANAAVQPEAVLGLPKDNYETTIDTFDYLAMIGMGQDTELRPLSLAPGTILRQRSKEAGIQEFLENPPYYVLETSWMTEDDMLDAVADFEESFDVSWSRPVAPSFRPERGGFVSCVDLRKQSALDNLLIAPERLAASVTVLLDADDSESANRIARAARDLRKDNPFCLWQLVLHSDTAIPDSGLTAKLTDAFLSPEHFFELSRMFSMDPQPNFQTRVFFCTNSEALAIRSLKDYQQLETILVLGDAMPGPKILESLPFLCFDRETTPFELLYDVMSAYRGFPDLLVEGPRELFTQ
jgi:hypothetical protein